MRYKRWVVMKHEDPPIVRPAELLVVQPKRRCVFSLVTIIHLGNRAAPTIPTYTRKYHV